jgi:hypothetical protein
MRNVSDETCRENQKSRLYETMWKNMVLADRPQIKMKHGASALDAA